MTDNMPQFIKIAAVENLIEAQVLEDALNEREIPFRIRSFHDTAYNGLFQFQKGWGVIYAPAAYEKEILETIENLRQSLQSADAGDV